MLGSYMDYTLPTIPQLPTLNQVRDSPAHLGVITAAPHKWGKKHHLTQFLACNFNYEIKQQWSQKPSKVIEVHFWKIRSSFLGPPVAIYRSVKVMAASKGHRRASRGVSSKAVVASSGFRWGWIWLSGCLGNPRWVKSVDAKSAK